MYNETIFRPLNSHYPQSKKTFNFTQEGLNRALSAKAGPCTGLTDYGLYFAEFQTKCLYSGNKRRESFYFRQATINDNPPDDPVSAADTVYAHASTNQLRRNCILLGNNSHNLGLGEGGGGVGGGGGDGTTQDSDRTPKRARRGACNTNDDTCPAIEITPGRAVDAEETVTADVGVAVLPLFWDSPEASKLFGFSFRNGYNVYKGLTNIIQLLSHAQQSHDGYRRFVANVDRAPLTPTQIFFLESQCLYL